MKFKGITSYKGGTAHLPILGEYARIRRIPNIRQLSRAFSHKLTGTGTDLYIGYSPIFVYSANLDVPRMYSEHNDEYEECSITCSPILGQHSRLFSENKLMYSSALRNKYTHTRLYNSKLLLAVLNFEVVVVWKYFV